MTRDEILTLRAESQRLRAALDWVKRRFDEEWTYELGIGEVVEEIIAKFEEALSITTVQSERMKPFQQRLVELKHKYSSRNRGDGGMVKVCKRHTDNPVKIYHQCVGCELEWFREELEQKQQEIKRLEQECDKLIEGLREIDTHIRSTPEPVQHIVETLKRVLPEYREGVTVE